jgi:hypothetical protein
MEPEPEISNVFSILDNDYKYVENNHSDDEPEPKIKSKPKLNKKQKLITYEQKIKIIQEYFGVSEMCAIYLYHRRRRGVPWHKPDDPKYLEWTIELQNAILHLDTIPGFDWRSLEFGYEEIQFMRNNIYLNNMSSKISVLSVTSNVFMESTDNDGFKTVRKNKVNITKELNRMGLLPRSYCIKKN